MEGLLGRMTPYYKDADVTLYLGDCRDVLAGLPAGVVSCVATSPPFYGQRTYNCSPSAWPDGWEGHLGAEPTAEAYVAHTIDWLRAVKRVLRKDGVCWVDLDDSRVAKALCLIPQRVALAAQADGWTVRSEILITSWMPEPAKDRPTDACRKVLMLVKDKRYWYDGQAVRVEGASKNDSRYKSGRHEQRAYHVAWQVDAKFFPPDGLRNLGNVWEDIPSAGRPSGPGFEHFAAFAVEEPERCFLASCPAEICVKCGKARARVMGSEWESHQGRTAAALDVPGSPMFRGGGHHQDGLPYRGQQAMTGWTDCGCGAGYEPGVGLDPFIGTGTTAIAARKLGRKCIGIDASEDYLRQTVARLQVGDAGIRKLVEARRAGAEQRTLWEAADA